MNNFERFWDEDDRGYICGRCNQYDYFSCKCNLYDKKIEPNVPSCDYFEFDNNSPYND